MCRGKREAEVDNFVCCLLRNKSELCSILKKTKKNKKNIAPFVSTQKVDPRILLYLIYYTKKLWFWTIIHPFICRAKSVLCFIQVLMCFTVSVRTGQICS